MWLQAPRTPEQDRDKLCPVSLPSVPPMPPSCSDCATKTQAPGGTPPTQSASRMWRSSSGSMRLDTPTTSIISNPAAQKTILLDHLKKEAMVIPTPPAAATPPSPGAPKMPGAPASPPPLHVADLGKSMIEGHEVEGKRFTFTPPQAPAAPPGSGETAGPTNAENSRARVGRAPETSTAAQTAAAHRHRSLDQRKTKNARADKSYQPRRRANHLLRAHLDRRTSSLSI
jgi:hypothetical protein